MNEKSCYTCKFLKRYTSEDGYSWMNVCEADEPDEIDDGFFFVSVVDLDTFDASLCLGYKKKRTADHGEAR